MLHSGHVDGFCIVSSDSDFTGLAKRIREQGMFVMGIGKRTTPESFRRACGVFTYVEMLSYDAEAMVKSQPKNPDTTKAAIVDQAEQQPVQERQPPDWKDVVRKAIEMTAHEEWSRLADVGNGIRRIDSSFDTREYGSKTLLSLIRTAPDEFEVREEKQAGHPSVPYVRKAEK